MQDTGKEKRSTLLETYLDISEALLVYEQQSGYPSGFSIQPDGDGGSYLTMAIVAKLKPEEIMAWRPEMGPLFHQTILKITDGAADLQLQN